MPSSTVCQHTHGFVLCENGRLSYIEISADVAQRHSGSPVMCRSRIRFPSSAPMLPSLCRKSPVPSARWLNSKNVLDGLFGYRRGLSDSGGIREYSGRSGRRHREGLFETFRTTRRGRAVRLLARKRTTHTHGTEQWLRQQGQTATGARPRPVLQHARKD